MPTTRGNPSRQGYLTVAQAPSSDGPSAEGRQMPAAPNGLYVYNRETPAAAGAGAARGNSQQEGAPPNGIVVATVPRKLNANRRIESGGTTCQWLGPKSRRCKSACQKGTLYCKVHCCSKPGCHVGCSSKDKFCPEHRASGTVTGAKRPGKLGSSDVARCSTCQSKLSVCVCGEPRGRARTSSKSSSKPRKKLGNSDADSEMDL